MSKIRAFFTILGGVMAFIGLMAIFFGTVSSETGAISSALLLSLGIMISTFSIFEFDTSKDHPNL